MLIIIAILHLCCIAPLSDCATIEHAFVASGYRVDIFAQGLKQPRQLAVTAGGDLLVLEQRAQRVTRIANDGTATVAIDGSKLGLNHGLASTLEHVYASSSSAVYRFPFGNLSHVELFVANLPGTGHRHPYHSLHIHQHFLYLHIGSKANVDADSAFARIYRFAIPAAAASPSPQTLADGVLVADGLRNAMAFAYHEHSSTLVALDCGYDDAARPDLAPDHSFSPCEGLVRIDVDTDHGSGNRSRFFWYPYCFPTTALPSSHLLYAVNPTATATGNHSDEWCRDGRNTTASALCLPAHSTPLGIAYSRISGDAFVALHGSWNAAIPAGYKVLRLARHNNTVTPLFQYAGASSSSSSSSSDNNALWNRRPVDVKIKHIVTDTGEEREEIFVSDDANGVVYVFKAHDDDGIASSPSSPSPSSSSLLPIVIASQPPSLLVWKVFAIVFACALALFVLSACFVKRLHRSNEVGRTMTGKPKYQLHALGSRDDDDDDDDDDDVGTIII